MYNRTYPRPFREIEITVPNISDGFCVDLLIAARTTTPWPAQGTSVCRALGKPSTWFPSERPVECWVFDIGLIF